MIFFIAPLEFFFSLVKSCSQIGQCFSLSLGGARMAEQEAGNDFLLPLIGCP
jgi:hypothetical protein